jgi:hypothetical protein
VTEYPEIAEEVARKWGGKTAGEEPYIFELKIPELYLVRYNDEYFPAPDGNTASEGIYRAASGREYDLSDPRVESFTELFIRPEWIVGVRPVSGARPLDKLGATPGGKRWLHFF